MTFDEIWSQVSCLPNTAKAHIPEVLSTETKKRLAKLKPVEVASIVSNAIKEIDHGSIAPLDELVKKQL